MTMILPATCYNGYGLVSECTDIPCLPADWDVGSEEALCHSRWHGQTKCFVILFVGPFAVGHWKVTQFRP